MKPQIELLTAALMAPDAIMPEPDERVRDVLFYSGATISRYNFWDDEEYTITFSMNPRDYRFDRLNSGAPVFKDHIPMVDHTIGITSNARVEQGKAYATLKFSNTEELDGLWEDVKAGILNSVSMGVSIDQLEDVTPREKGATRAYIARGWEPFEISVVPIGADPKAKFLAAQYMSEQHFARLAARGQTPAPLPQPMTSPVDDPRVKLALALNLNQRERNRKGVMQQ